MCLSWTSMNAPSWSFSRSRRMARGRRGPRSGTSSKRPAPAAAPCKRLSDGWSLAATSRERKGSARASSTPLPPKSSGVQKMHRCRGCARAAHAPVQEVRGGVQEVHPNSQEQPFLRKVNLPQSAHSEGHGCRIPGILGRFREASPCWSNNGRQGWSSANSMASEISGPAQPATPPSSIGTRLGTTASATGTTGS